jgi:hypothetical protein
MTDPATNVFSDDDNSIFRDESGNAAGSARRRS